MNGEIHSYPRPVLDEATRSFVRRSLEAGLVELADLKKVVVSMMAESDSFTPSRLANGLVGAGVLTQWQAKKLLSGRSRGFYLGGYRLLRPLGKGGMGIVYLGEHHVMKRLMALKILPPEAVADTRRIERFKSEARACAQLDHENIVRAYDFAQSGEKLYIVMEYVDGVDLQYAVQRDGPMSVPDALDAVVQATRGIAHAHERGIIHRDIKPSNLLMRTDGVVKVSDLGLARIGWGAEGELGQSRLMGTADFVAPEQAINSNSADGRADIYSLGCTWYYLLSGQSPYAGTSFQRLAQHQTAPIPDIRTVRKDCPAAVAELIARMTAKRPENRPKSAMELQAQLERLLGVSGETTRRHGRKVVPAGDTVMDDTSYQATIDDTSLSSDGEVVVAVEASEFDFGSLPPIDLANQPVPNRPMPVTAAKPKVNVKSSVATTASALRDDKHQQLLLGVGLAVAVMAIIAVLGIGAVSLTRPLPTTSPVIKSVEDGDGRQVFIVRE
jgi:serine/threonine-protein kinase